MNSLQWLLSMETFFWGLVLRWKLLYNANFYFAISLSFLMLFLFFILTGFRDYSQSLPSHWYWACWKYHRMISHDSLQARLTERIGHWFQIVVKNYLYLYNVAANSHIQLEDFYYSSSAQNSYSVLQVLHAVWVSGLRTFHGFIHEVQTRFFPRADFWGKDIWQRLFPSPW